MWQTRVGAFDQPPPIIGTPLVTSFLTSCVRLLVDVANTTGTGAFINLPTRQRKSNYDVNEYYRARMDSNKNIPGVRKRKVITWKRLK